MVEILDIAVGLYSFSDDGIYTSAPYYFQAGTQLGSYRSDSGTCRGWCATRASTGRPRSCPSR